MTKMGVNGPVVSVPAEREVFGDVLKAWFARNGWPQSITEAWAKSCGSPGPWASQISPAINYKLDPKAAFFVSLANFNQAVAERNVLSVTNERVRNLLLKGEPLCHDSGVPFAAEDFFKLFVGLLEPPAEYLGEPEPSRPVSEVEALRKEMDELKALLRKQQQG